MRIGWGFHPGWGSYWMQKTNQWFTAAIQRDNDGDLNGNMDPCQWPQQEPIDWRYLA